MKKFTLLIIVFTFYLPFGVSVAQSEQEKLDLPGDNLNLYATMKLFQDSETLEGFEKTLNDESSQINNLDLNGDGHVDYIEVSDNVVEDIHYISLKIAVNENEIQDVAVFIVDKDGNGEVQIQLVGDEDLYGKDYIIEPNSEAASGGSTPNPGYSPNNSQPVIVQNNNNYQVSAWPVIQYIYVPTYRIWRSPWHWNAYPAYWHPWTPSYWHYYYGYHYNMFGYYNGNYRRSQRYIYPAWRQHYYSGGLHSSSVYVTNRSKRGDYNRTYSKPGLAKQGYNVFRKNNPNVTTGNNRLPSFDKSGRPVIKQPAISRPVTTSPVTTRPGNGNTNPSRPVTTPPGTTRPGNENNTPSRPPTRPANREVTPSRTVTRPAVTQPAQTRQPTARPANTRPTENKPASRERKPNNG